VNRKIILFVDFFPELKKGLKSLEFNAKIKSYQLAKYKR